MTLATTNKTLSFKYYSDPGHGWVKVPHALLARLGIADNITPWSYTRGEYAYLEQDSDLSTFHNAMLAKAITPRYISSSTRDKSSKIRSYDSYGIRIKNDSRNPLCA